jgi:hypothetical protein
MGTLLNQQVDASAVNGFSPVDGIASAFYRHGYCAKATYIRTITTAASKRNLEGPFHPNVIGHEYARDANLLKLCGVLYKNTDCTSKNPNV